MDVNNQGLNLPSNLQNLDVRNELLSTEVGSGASCAYSLRDLTGSNKKVVRVRRTPHDESSSIDDERIFGCQEVQAGYVEDWVNGKLEHTLPCDVATASAGYSLRKVKASYGVPVTEVNGTDGFPATIPTSGSPADIGNGFTVHKFSDGSADSFDATHSGGVITVTVTKASASTFSSGLRIKGLDTGKQYTVSGEFRATSLGADGDGTATVDISDATAGTDEDTVSTTSTSFTPFFIDSGYNATDSTNFVDLQARSFGSNSGTITAEFRNIKIIENNNSAVRIRRSSDDEEVVVGFDSDNKVSASSPVTATPSGSTTATDLNGFLNETLTVGTAVNGTGSYPYDSFTANGNTGFTVTNDGVAQVLFPYKSSLGDVVVVNFDLNITNGTPSPSVATRSATNSVTSRSNSTIVSSSGNHTVTMTCNTDGTHIGFSDGHTGTYTISNFKIVSHTHQAFVHTWYDQAGVNNAVQETAGSQPKIAENGALLADGITFDGSDDFLQTSTQVLTNTYTGARSLYGVCKINTDSGYIFGDAGSGTDEGTSFYSDTSSDKILFTNGKSGTLTTFDNITTIEGSNFLISSNYNNNNATTIHKNANNNGYIQGTGSYNFSTSSKFTIGDREGGSSSATRLDGTIQEIIAYNSDQSDNRFKIESNINNYYGLYNDANELSAAFDSNGTITSESKDGFTADVATFSHYVNATFNNSVATGETIYVSFNAQLAPNGGTSASPILRLQDAQVGGNTSNQSSISEGFNSIDLTATGTSDRVGFLEQDDNVDYIISDFKVSRIARNGFVETWYDQSGNNRDASQGTAGSQPFIVRNGGQVKLQNQPSIDFDGRGSSSATGLVTNYDISSDGSLTEYSIYGVFDNTVSTPHSSLISAGKPISSSTSYGGFDVFVNQSGGRLEIEHQEHANTSKTTIRPTNSYTTGDGYKIITINYNSSSLLSKLVNVTSGSSAENTSPALPKARDDIAVAQYLKIGGSYTFEWRNPWQGFISEIIMFEDDIRSDNDDIVDNLTDFYGQPSSTP